MQYKLWAFASWIGISIVHCTSILLCSVVFSLTIFPDLLSTVSAYLVFRSWLFPFTTMSHSGAGPLFAAPGPPLVTAFDGVSVPVRVSSVSISLGEPVRPYTQARMSATTGRTLILRTSTCSWTVITSACGTPTVDAFRRPP